MSSPQGPYTPHDWLQLSIKGIYEDLLTLRTYWIDFTVEVRLEGGTGGSATKLDFLRI